MPERHPRPDRPLTGCCNRTRRRTRIGLVSGGLGAYWPQFPDLLPQLRGLRPLRHRPLQRARRRRRRRRLHLRRAGGRRRPRRSCGVADCDLVVIFLATYLTSSMVLPDRPAGQDPGAGDRPAAHRERWTTPTSTPATGLPTAASARSPRSPTSSAAPASRSAPSPGTCARSPPGSASTSGCTRPASAPGCAPPATGSWATCTRACWTSPPTSPTVSTTFGSHVEVLEFDDLRERVNAVTDARGRRSD